MKQQNTSKWFSLLIVLTGPLLTVIDIFIINMAIPAIKKGVQASDGEIQLVIAGYLLGSAAFLIIGGRAGDHLGKKKVFFWGMCWFTITSCLCGLAQSALQLNIMRFFQGISASFMAPQCIAFIHVLFDDQQEKAKAVGWYGITLSIAAIIGQILGGYLSETSFIIAGWRLIFFINLPVGIFALWAIKKYLPETPVEKGKGFDHGGAITLTAALVCLIYPLTEGREMGWPWWSIAMMVLALVVAVCFVKDQRRKVAAGGAYLIDMQLFRIREFNIGLMAVLFHFMMHTAFLLMSALYLQNGLGLSALQCGVYFILHAILFMITAFVASKLIVRFGKMVLQVGMAIILLSFLLMIFLFKAPANGSSVMLLIGLYGLGNGMVLPSLLTIALKSIPEKFAGVSAGIFSTFQQTASALGISVIGGVFFYVIQQSASKPDYFLAFKYGILTDIGFLLLAAWMLYLLPRASGKGLAQAGVLTD